MTAHKAGLLEGKNITGSKWPHLREKINSSDESLFADKMPKAITEIFQPSTGKEVETDRAIETGDGLCH